MRRTCLKIVCMVCMVSAGCQKSYWVATSDLNQAQKLQLAAPAAPIALRGSEQRPPSADTIYLRASALKAAPAGVVLGEPYVLVKAPNKRSKTIGGATLTALGGALVIGGVAMIGYGASLEGRDHIGAGIIAGLGGLPLGIGLPLVIAGGVLLGRGAGPPDIVPAGLPGTTYVPAL